eukprot:Plantae.Rhodophyta-Purpureofilum_apyrenoidigerum.ctg45915.p1 GENE.Plantae.Rhodophyta-Purpureofilum_apyrenoidigerum.ctg45915~~Plantae.Rhodophyta-Purpureofilum_apyrenoidigerum.ctg45915.p1  ORF type:complete len:341 (-),score=69.45 Plantae.Rhodophyta-Purpureofilum_apyrenoidigerum.ctg45915:91-1113(-)
MMFRSVLRRNVGWGAASRRLQMGGWADLHALVVAEVGDDGIALSSLSTVTAAKQAVGGDGQVSLLMLGSNVGKLKSPMGVDKMFVVKGEKLDKLLAETVTPIVLGLQKENSFSHIFASATSFGKNFMPRVAAKLNAAQVSDVISVRGSDEYVRPIYAGNALAKVKSHDKVQVVTVRGTAFEKAGQSDNDAEVVSIDGENDNTLSKWMSEDLTEAGARPDLTSARVVVSGGRGLKSGENFAIIEKLADTLGGAVGATRAAVDDGYCPNDMQVGQTGKVVAPELYIAVGLSGAVQHLAGMKDSKTIVAINKDPEAPIFTVADYGLVADLFETVPQLTDKLKK